MSISLLQEFKDVFPKNIPSGLPPIRRIEHQNNLVHGVVIPNRPTYQSNPDETKILRKQVKELMSKEYTIENMSSYIVQVLLVSKMMELEGCVLIVMLSIILW